MLVISRKLFVAAAIAALLCGCTRPAVAPKPPSFQDQANAVRDWEDVARQIAGDMVRAGLLPDPLHPATTPSWNQPFYIQFSAQRPQFLHEVAESLEAEIVQHGGIVVRSPYGAAQINLDVDVVRWSPRNRLPDLTYTAAGLAGGTAVVLGNQPPLTPAAGFGLLAGAGILADLARTMTPHTHTEIAWGAQIIEGSRVVFAARYPMYIADADLALYEPAPPPPPPLVGPPLVQLRYAP